MTTASVAELKNGLSGFLERVKRGTSVLVTDHRRPVAIIARVPEDLMTPEYFELSAKGIIRPPQTRLDTEAFLRLPKACGSGSLAAGVLEDRDGR